MNKITILLIEDNPNDVQLIKELLDEISIFNYVLLNSGTLKDAFEQIKMNRLDLILLNLNLPDSTGHKILNAVLECYSDIPIVLISSEEDEELSLKLIKQGEQEYLTKQKLNKSILEKVILYSIERKRMEKALKKKSEELENLNGHFVAKELKMAELKIEVNELLKILGKKEKY